MSGPADGPPRGAGVSAESEARDLAQFLKERDGALLSLNEVRIRRYARKYGFTMPSNPESFWRAVHKARTGTTTLPVDARRQSKRWLKERHSQSSDDGAL